MTINLLNCERKVKNETTKITNKILFLRTLDCRKRLKKEQGSRKGKKEPSKQKSF